MGVKEYQRRMAKLGISRGALEDGNHINPSTCPVTALKEPELINRASSTKAPRPPMEPIPKHLVSKQSEVVKQRLRSAKARHL